eukprot:CAMPEP_0175065838 /NCGR_PEP_ID=MMETSP0052_2-20121109/16165_1 /TAXON_ID=51329 ORGANISM="Polytomella parva, Strain SAG 63-3" /NCGR_SAMPLE_ID=MMETSP0052_2 /ASSEMBLY_ACC=CAM_ASM_000194 /LENGTH=440 /DNA_ID=CAMNT_0016332453 /DNA_START=92 /DNA_END=1411 /DNA_ORIENTATION=-
MGDSDWASRKEYVPSSFYHAQGQNRPNTAQSGYGRSQLTQPNDKTQSVGSTQRVPSAASYGRPLTAGGGGVAAAVTLRSSISGRRTAPTNNGSVNPLSVSSVGSRGAPRDLSSPPQRDSTSRPSSAVNHEVGRLRDDVLKLRVALSDAKEDKRMMLTEKRRLQEDLSRMRINLQKAEELLNVREKALSPSTGLSQLYRTPETTALVSNLKNRVRRLEREKEDFRLKLEEHFKSIKATRLAEMQGELLAYQVELKRQRDLCALASSRMSDAEARADAAAQQAQAAMAAAHEFLHLGENMPSSPSRLSPGNTISSGRVRSTMKSLQQSHRVMLSQAQLIRSVFPPGLTMDEFSTKASLKAPTAGGTEVLRFLRYHVQKINFELQGFPGGRQESSTAQTPLLGKEISEYNPNTSIPTPTTTTLSKNASTPAASNTTQTPSRPV